MNIQGIRNILDSNLDNFANMFKQNIDDIAETAEKAKKGLTKDAVNNFFDSLKVGDDERLRHIAGTLKRKQNLEIDTEGLSNRVKNFTKLHENDIDRINDLNKLQARLNNGDIEGAIEQAGIVDKYISGTDNEKFTQFLVNASNDLKTRRQIIDNLDPSALKELYKYEVFNESSVSKIINKSGMFTAEEKSNIANSVVDKYFNPKDYFTHPDAKIRRRRIGTAVGAYGAGAMVTRKLQGGTLTKNEYGERDIAGIPLI